MLVRMSSEQIGDNWPIIKSAIKNSALPTVDTGEAKMRNVLKALLVGQAVCWVDGDPERPRTIIITSLSEESISETKNLLIYCAHAFARATSEDYLNMVYKIGEYARGMECDNVIAYVWNPKMLQLLKKYGAETNYTLVVMPLR
jgi:hypothetical protein